jgi:hypothetical protein
MDGVEALEKAPDTKTAPVINPMIVFIHGFAIFVPLDNLRFTNKLPPPPRFFANFLAKKNSPRP